MGRLQELEQMLDESPDDPFIIYALAREYEQTQATMQALLMYEHLITDHPKYIATYYHYAKLLYTAGNKPEGIKMLQRGIEMGLQEKDMHAVSEMRGLLSSWVDDEEYLLKFYYDTKIYKYSHSIWVYKSMPVSINAQSAGLLTEYYLITSYLSNLY